MRVLLDECVPRALRNEIPGHEVKTVAEVGWAGVKNGELLELAVQEFDLLLTVDRNLEYQQSFAGLTLAVIVVHGFEQRHCPTSAFDAGGARCHIRHEAGNRNAYPWVTRNSLSRACVAVDPPGD